MTNMPNPKAKVKIQLDKERHLFLSLNAMVDFEQETGKNLMSMNEDMTASEMRTLLWLCLRHEDEELTKEDVGDMIHAGNMMAITDKLSAAFDLAVPEGGGDSNAKNLSRPTG